METINCKSCGAPLSFDFDNGFAVCDYCGAKNILKNENVNESIQKNEKTNNEKEDIIIDTIPCIGSTIFQKKLFVVHRTYAVMIDKKTNTCELRIDYKDVMKYGPYWVNSVAIQFKMKNGKKHTINFYFQNRCNTAMNALNGLIQIY